MKALSIYDNGIKKSLRIRLSDNAVLFIKTTLNIGFSYKKTDDCLGSSYTLKIGFIIFFLA